MKKLVEQIVIGVLVAALVIAFIGLIAEVKVMAYIAISILMAASIAYGVLQIKDYTDSIDGSTVNKKLLANMIVTVVVVLVVLVIGILTLCGKLF